MVYNQSTRIIRDYNSLAKNRRRVSAFLKHFLEKPLDVWLVITFTCISAKEFSSPIFLTEQILSKILNFNVIALKSTYFEWDLEDIFFINICFKKGLTHSVLCMLW